jgi:hypothetical protein
MDVPCRRCGGPTHQCQASDLAYGFACIHCDSCDESWQEQDGRPKKTRKAMPKRLEDAIENLSAAACGVRRALEAMNDRSTNCSCGSRRYEDHKEHLAAQEMRAILGRIDKVQTKLAETASKETP